MRRVRECDDDLVKRWSWWKRELVNEDVRRIATRTHDHSEDGVIMRSKVRDVLMSVVERKMDGSVPQLIAP